MGGSRLERQVWKDAGTREARPQTWSTQKPEVKAGSVSDAQWLDEASASQEMNQNPKKNALVRHLLASYP